MQKTAQDLTLTCHSEILPDTLRLHYAISNRGRNDVYLLDVFPAVDQTGRKPVADFHAVYVCWRDGAVAHLLKGIAPLPGHKLDVRHIPLGTRLSPGEKRDRTFDVPLPLKEQSPYYGPLEPQSYEKTKIHTLLLTVQFLRSTVEGFGAEVAPHGPDLFRVRGKHTVGQAENLQCEFNIKDMILLKRKDKFSRI